MAHGAPISVISGAAGSVPGDSAGVAGLAPEWRQRLVPGAVGVGSGWCRERLVPGPLPPAVVSAAAPAVVVG